MNWRPILVHVAWLAALAVVVETGTIWVCSSWFWTPIQRHYLPAYIWCSLPVITPSTVEVSWIWKTGQHGKLELATEDDIDASADETGIVLSHASKDDGWKGLVEGPPQQVPTEQLSPGLAGLAFDGEGLWSFLLLPEACGLVAFGYGLCGFVRLTNRFADWAVERSFDRHRSWSEAPSWSLLDRCEETMQKLRSSVVALHRHAQRCIERRRAETNHSPASSEPETRPPSFAIPIFGVYNGTGDGAKRTRSK